MSLCVTYRRVSTTEQGDSGAGLEAQESRLASEIAMRGWTRVGDYKDIASGKTTAGRDQLDEALRLVRSGETATTLMVMKLDRLCRSVLDFALLVADAGKVGWNLVLLDPAVDLSTPSGLLLANIMASVAQWERQMIGARTSDALRALQANGVTLGRPPALPLETVQDICARRSNGETYQRIADLLNELHVPTAHGGDMWHPATARAVCRSQAGRSALASTIATTGE